MYAILIVCAFIVFQFNSYFCSGQVPSRIENELENGLTLESFIYWPNGTIPFYIDLDHYDSEQTVKIMQVLSYFSFKTCLKFAPVISPTQGNRVLVIENPEGLRKCTFDTRGHEYHGSFTLILGYDCLTSPNIDMMIMHTLGIPFEHNRVIRDLYIDVQFENIEPGEPIEVSTILIEDLEAIVGKENSEDLLQDNITKVERRHQIAGGFLMKISDLDVKNIKFTHLDISPSCGRSPSIPTAVPILSLCRLHKVFD